MFRAQQGQYPIKIWPLAGARSKFFKVLNGLEIGWNERAKLNMGCVYLDELKNIAYKLKILP